jgi:hypothetical protein
VIDQVLHNDGTVAGALNALRAAGPIPDQNLNLISLELIRSNLGDRWPSKREQVWNQVEKFLRHQFRPEDLILRLDDVSVLIGQPGRLHLAAQFLCVRAANELMRFFLGESSRGNVTVRTVTDLDGQEVTCTPIPRRQIDAALLPRDSAAWRPLSAVNMPILTKQSRDLSMAVSLAPVLALQSGASTIGYAVRTVLSDAISGHVLSREERASLQPSDLADADLKVLTGAFARRRELNNPAATLIVPIAFTTLAHSSSRYACLQYIHQLCAEDRHGLILEIVDFQPGAPVGRIAELCAIARPHCRGVMCRMDASVSSAEKLKAAGATLSVQSDLAHASENTFLKREQTIAAVLKIIPTVMVHDVPPDLIPVAACVRVTHCTVASG